MSELNIRDADSDVIFDSERTGLTICEYNRLKELALKSAADFYRLYDSFPDKNKSCLPERETFYGKVPRTAKEIGIEAGNEGTILESRIRGFEILEKSDGFLMSNVLEGSYGELWSLSKVLRRFIWHDRIHAKALYRMGIKTFGIEQIPNIFKFKI